MSASVDPAMYTLPFESTALDVIRVKRSPVDALAAAAATTNAAAHWMKQDTLETSVT